MTDTTFRSRAIAATVMVWATLGLATTSANATTYTYNFSGDFGPPSFTATTNLDVIGGQAVSGAGTITFGSNTFDLTLITLSRQPRHRHLRRRHRYPYRSQRVDFCDFG
jgi:hypothetical protein